MLIYEKILIFIGGMLFTFLLEFIFGARRKVVGIVGVLTLLGGIACIIEDIFLDLNIGVIFFSGLLGIIGNIVGLIFF